jgi:hypothetical protein
VIRTITCTLTLVFALRGFAAPEVKYDFVVIPPGVRELFLDDYMTGGIYRVTRKVHQPIKGAIVLRADRPWETTIVRRGSTVPSEIVEFYNPPVWDPDEKVYKMWYIIGDAAATGFARSRDGVHWEKPNLGVTEFRGSKENNLVSVRDQPKAMIVHVLRDPDDTPDRRYKGMAFLGAAGRQLIVSRDGYEFRALPQEPIPGQDTSHLNWDERARQYVLTVKHPGPFGRSVWLSTSKDFEHWTPHELIFYADALDQELGRRRIRQHLRDPGLYHPHAERPDEFRTEVYQMPVFPYESVYIGLPVFFEAADRIGPPFNNQDGINSVKLSVSRDLRSWVKVGARESFIPVSRRGPGVLDTGQLLTASRPVVRDDELWFYYSGVDVRYPPDGVFHSAVYIARLRRDGFVSMAAGAEEGFVETRSVRLDGTRLFVNVDARRGELSAEITGRELPPGFADVRSQPIRGDQLRAEVVWPSGTDLKALAGRTVRIRFYLKNAGLYSFWIER